MTTKVNVAMTPGATFVAVRSTKAPGWTFVTTVTNVEMVPVWATVPLEGLTMTLKSNATTVRLKLAVLISPPPTPTRETL